MTPIEEITHDLRSEMEIERVFQKHIVDGASYFFRENLNAPNLEYALRHDIANCLNININDVVIVGSAKLGFSVKNKEFKSFDQRFNETRLGRHKSDIDLAVVSREVFEKQAKIIFEMSRHFKGDWIRDNWQVNFFYKTASDLQKVSISSLYEAYVKYLARGWFRVDLCPNRYIETAPWNSNRDTWYKSIKRKITVGLYSDWYYLKHYQMDNLLNLRLKIRNLEISNV